MGFQLACQPTPPSHAPASCRRCAWLVARAIHEVWRGLPPCNLPSTSQHGLTLRHKGLPQASHATHWRQGLPFVAAAQPLGCWWCKLLHAQPTAHDCLVHSLWVERDYLRLANWLMQAGECAGGERQAWHVGCSAPWEHSQAHVVGATGSFIVYGMRCLLSGVVPGSPPALLLAKYVELAGVNCAAGLRWAILKAFLNSLQALHIQRSPYLRLAGGPPQARNIRTTPSISKIIT